MYGGAQTIIQALGTNSYLTIELELTKKKYFERLPIAPEKEPGLLDINWFFVSRRLLDSLEEHGFLVMAEFGGMNVWGYTRLAPTPFHKLIFHTPFNILEPNTLYQHSGASCGHPKLEHNDYFRYNIATFTFERYDNIIELEALTLRNF